MNRLTSRFVPLVALALVALAACGGGAESRPTPLKVMLDEVHIARVAPDQRPQVTTAQNDFQLARSENLTAQENAKSAETEVQLAKGEVDQALIEERQAKLKQRDADASADLTRKNLAASETRAAQLGRRAADLKLAYMKARRAYQQRWLMYTEYNIYAKEAKFELEKAKVARANNIQPQGFAFDKFESQYRERSEALQRYKQKVDADKAKMVEKEREWLAADKEWKAAKGIKETPKAPGAGNSGEPTGQPAIPSKLPEPAPAPAGGSPQ
jgi:hypothetical protein